MQHAKPGGGRAVVVAGVVAACAAALWWSVAAFGQDLLRDALLRNQAVVEAALYETTDGGRVFVLDRTGEPPLLQFGDSFEVLALSRVPASRGDEILRMDTGDDLVRVTALGGVTLYPRERPTGVPATRLGPADPLPSLDQTRPDVIAAFRFLTAQAGDAEVDAPVSPAAAAEANALLADAVRLTAEGLRLSAAEGDGTRAAVTRVEFVYGAGADARMTDGTLRVQLDPERGYAGRPSSLKIADAVAVGD